MTVAVIGAGVVGLSTTSVLLERGVDVVCFERTGPMSQRSAGESRIFRLAHRDPGLVELARRSRRAFAAWENRCGQRLVEPVGTVISGDVQEWADAMATAGAGLIDVADDAVLLRLPTSRVPGRSIIDPAGGVIRVDRVGAFLRRVCGPVIRPEHVLALEETARGVVVRTDRSQDTFDSVVLAAGAGNAPLGAQVGLYPPVALAHHARFTFPLRPHAPTEPRAWITPSATGGLRTYQHSGTTGHWAVGVELDPDAVRWDVGRDTAVENARRATLAYVEAELEHVEPRIVGELYCTTNPGLGDGIHHLRKGRALAVYGENLFKFAPLIGLSMVDALAG